MTERWCAAENKAWLILLERRMGGRAWIYETAVPVITVELEMDLWSSTVGPSGRVIVERVIWYSTTERGCPRLVKVAILC